MRAAIYARVSSAAQRDNHTIENQLRTLPAYVEQQGWKLVATFVDDGHSAKSGMLDKRDGFAQMQAAIARRSFDVLVVVDIDRLTRTEDAMERAEILGPFQRANIRIATPSMGLLDMRTMLGELYVTLQALYAAEENRKRAERIKLGKARAIAENRKPAGPTPFGLKYDRAAGVWTIDEPAAEVIREIARRVRAGESCVRIADDFAGRMGIAQPRGGWTRAAVYRTVAATYVYGEWIANKKLGLAVKVPAIVTRDEWHEVKVALHARRRSSLGRTKHVYLLQDIAQCGRCGASIHVRSGVSYYNAAHQPREHPASYMCSARKLRKLCDERSVPCKVLDAKLWERLCEELEHPDLLQALADAEVRRAGDTKDWQADIDGYRSHLARLDKVHEKVMALYRRGLVSEEALEHELAAAGRERKMVREQIETAERAVGAHQSAQARLRSAGVMIDRLRAALPQATLEQRQALIRELAVAGTVKVRDGKVALDLRIVRPLDRSDTQPQLAVVKAGDYRMIHGHPLRLRLLAG